MNSSPSAIDYRVKDLHPGRNLEAWKAEICAANNAFVHGKYLRALRGYQAALELANIGINQLLNTDGIPFPNAGGHAERQVERQAERQAERQIAALVVTRHNLADLCRQSGELVQTTEHLCCAHETLFRFLYHPSSVLKILAQRHMRVTYRELLSFIREQGIQPRIQQSLLISNYVCNCCRDQIFH